MIESAKADVVRPAVAANDPDARTNKTAGDRQEIAGVVRIHFRKPAIQLRDSLTLRRDAAFF